MSMTPNPGSDEAIKQGCLCPVYDNHHGDQELGDTRGFWINEGCPLHAVAVAEPLENYADHLDNIKRD